MTLRQADMEGQAPGTIPGVANSSTFGDDPFDAVSISAMAVQYSNSAAHGTGGMTFGSATSGQYGVLRYGNFSNAKAATRVYLRLRAYPGNEFQFCHMQNGTTSISGFNITPTGTVKVVGPGATLLYTSTAAMTLNSWYRLEFVTAVSATAGQIKFAGYALDNASAISGMAFDTGTAFNTGTALLDKVEVGKITSSAATGPFDIDDWAVNDGTSTYIGVYTNPAPTPKAVVTTGSAVIDCTGTIPGVTGDTITYTISPSNLATQPARGIFVVPQQATNVTYTITCAESNNTSKTTTVVVPSASATTSTTATPQVFHNGTWQ